MKNKERRLKAKVSKREKEAVIYRKVVRVDAREEKQQKNLVHQATLPNNSKNGTNERCDSSHRL